ncbi:MAG: hypothetical protein D3911_03450 [Candidatus Electrothrix sp. AW3_4]|nr:hypothetical protein [Candidatus Electrothrix gigas]
MQFDCPDCTDLQPSEVTLEGRSYQKLEIADTGMTHEVGKPQVPVRGVLFAVPDNTEINVELLDADVESHTGFHLAPTPSIDERGVAVAVVDDETYQTDAFWPGSPVTMGLKGYIRDQRVAQLQFFPVQYNPVQDRITVYKRMLVRVNFLRSPKSVQSRTAESVRAPADTSFDQVLSSLVINPKELKPPAANVASASRENRELASTTCPEPGPAAWKIMVEQDGMYVLTYQDLSAAGMDLANLDLRRLRMTNQGLDVAIEVSGEADGRFDSTDTITFYGEAMSGLFTRTNVYWLSVAPDGGPRMPTRTSQHSDAAWRAGAAQLTAFKATAHEEEDSIYWSYMPDGAGQDHWFQEQLNGGQSFDMSLSLDNPTESATESATVRVMLHGKTDDYSHDPDHHTRIFLNSSEIDDRVWNGQGTFLHEVSVPQESLVDGENIITVTSAGDTGAGVDTVYVNYAEIDFTAKYIAENDRLRCTATGDGKYLMDISGFTGNDIALFDLSDPYNVVRIENLGVESDSQSGFTLHFGEQLEGQRTYLALQSGQFLQPAGIEEDEPSLLQSSCHSAEYIILSHDSFDVSELESLVSARGLQVMSVKVSDVYDEFNHGIFDPKAIRDFLAYAYENYALRPKYVVFVGDANQDYMNRLGYGINYIPTHLFQTSSLGDTASDNWFVSVSGDDPFPDMYAGRIPVRTQAELDAVVAKLAGYEQDVPADGWEKNVLMVADDEANFEGVSDRLVAGFLEGYNAKKVYLSGYAAVDDATADIVGALDAGAVLTSYVGHGSLDNWAGEYLFQSSDVAALNNPDRLSFVVALNCLNGWFSYYKRERTIAEEFLLAEHKGAVGVWASTGLGYTSEHEVLARELFKKLFQEKEAELGDLTTAAKISAVVNYGISADSLEMFTLFGEPSTRLHLSRSRGFKGLPFILPLLLRSKSKG